MEQSKFIDNDPLSPNPPRLEIISYNKLRAFIGITGIILPVVVVLGSLIFGAGEHSLQRSVSHYYYSLMHIVFISVLCVLGGFLIAYRGKNAWESRISNIAGCCAFGVATFPTAFGGFQPEKDGKNQYINLISEVSDFWGGVHFAFAGGLFICFIIFCLYFFQKPDKEYTGEEAVKFKRRKSIYKICGWIITASILLIAFISFVIKPSEGLLIYSTFFFETTSLWAFGTAWLIKGSSAFKETPVVKSLVKSIR